MRFGKKQLILVAALVIIAGFLWWILWPLRQPESTFASTRLLDRDGGLIYEVPHPEFGVVHETALVDIPQHAQEAVIAAEDADFYAHRGIDWSSFARAIATFNWRGVSTLEQQVVKMVYYPTARRSVWQKGRELAAVAVWSATHSKEETLQTYLNRAYFGQRAYGLPAAARQYFNKSVSDLTLGESAMLAGLLPAPARFDPYRHWDEAKERQAGTLSRLASLGKITANEHQSALDESIVLHRPRVESIATHFVQRVLQEIESQIPDIQTGGYTITTTLDPALQTLASRTIDRRLDELKNQRVGNAAVMALDPVRGEILAYVGSADFYNEAIDGQVDMAGALRQPGSALKPFLYWTAFQQDFSPSTVVADLPVRFSTAGGMPYYPRNYGYGYNGPVSLRDALGSSLNIPAVRVLDQIGLPTFFASLKQVGLNFPQPPEFYGLGIVLGGGEVTLETAMTAYGQLASYGQPVVARSVLMITDAAGRSVPLDRDARSPSSAAKPSLVEQQSAALVADVLSDPAARIRSFGEANLLDVGKRVAVKTGTTKDFRDNWAFGYTPDFVLGVWVGNADNTPMEGVSGITGAVPIWHDIMLSRVGRGQDIVWSEPDGLVRRQVCATSGLLATEICPKQKLERFIAGNEPTQYDDWYRVFDIDARTGGLLTDSCRTQVTPRVYLVPPAQYAGWSAAAGHEQPPTTDCEGRPVAGAQQAQEILLPLDGDVFVIDPHLDLRFQRIPLMAGGPGPYRWSINGRIVETPNSTYLLDPVPGEFIVDLANRQVRFTVQ